MRVVAKQFRCLCFDFWLEAGESPVKVKIIMLILMLTMMRRLMILDDDGGEDVFDEASPVCL